jgi:hypothetical protein
MNDQLKKLYLKEFLQSGIQMILLTPELLQKEV